MVSSPQKIRQERPERRITLKTDHLTGPSYAQLRPYKAPMSDAFPVYPDLVDKLVGTDRHPDDDIRFVMAVCASYAYGDASTLAMMTTRMGLEESNCFMVSIFVDALLLTSVAYLIQSRDGRVVIVCYRGTPPTSAITWLTDFQVDPAMIKMPFPNESGSYDDYQVHGGFYRNVRSTRYQIIDALKRAINGYSVQPGGPKLERRLDALYITGHSLGGASAALLAAMLMADTAYAPFVPKLKAVYTYGAPMVGDRAFATACNGVEFLRESVIRHVYGTDIVPQLPPKESGSFEHFGQEYQYTPVGDGGLWRHNEVPRHQLSNLIALLTTPASFLARQLKATRNFRFSASIDDHLPQHYIAATVKFTPDRVRNEFGD